MRSPLNIVCFYADLGNPYFPLLEEMTLSAKRVMPESRTVLLTPTPVPEICDLFDTTVDFSRGMTTTRDTICYDRVRATLAWQNIATEPTVYTDPDISFRRPVEFSEDFDVGLLWRTRKPDQPVNTGLVLAKPGFPAFWKRYGAIAVNLPAVLRSWWCDQLAYSVLTGADHEAGDTFQVFDARVRLFDWLKACAPPEKNIENPWAVHMKGDRKWNAEGKAA